MYNVYYMHTIKTVHQLAIDPTNADVGIFGVEYCIFWSRYNTLILCYKG